MINNKTKILTGIASLGVLTTLGLAVRDTRKASKKITDDMSVKQKIKSSWICYIPSSISAIGTISCILCLEKSHQQEKTALLAAISAIQGNYKNLKNVVDKEINVENKEDILKKVIREQVPRDVYIENTELKTFYEEYSGVFFISDIDSVLKAEYLFNKHLSLTGRATLNDFYKYLGLKETQEGDYVGWIVDDLINDYESIIPWVNFGHEKMIGEEGMEYYYISYLNHPDGLYKPD